MKRANFLLITVAAMATFSCSKTQVKYPETRKCDVVDEYFNVQVADPYRWLEDDKSDEVAQWVQAQNAVTTDFLAHIPFRNALKTRLTELSNYDAMGCPIKRGDRYFFPKKTGLQNQSVLYTAKSLAEEPSVLLDPNTMSDDGTVALSGYMPSHDGKYLAYSISDGGSDWQVIKVMDVETGKQLPDQINWVKFSGISWYNDGFYYSRYDAPDEATKLSGMNKNHKVCYHKIGTNTANDPVVFSDKNHPLRSYTAYVTHDQNYLIVSETESTYGNSLYIMNLHDSRQEFTQLTTGFEFEYQVLGHVDGNLIVHTNFKAPKYKLIKININTRDVGNWRDIIPERKDVLSSCQLVDGKIIANYIVDAKNKAEVYDLSGKKLHDIQFPSIGTVGGFSGNFNQKEAFYAFTSFTTPSTIYSYDIDNNTSTVLFQPNLNFKFDDYQSQQVFYTSKDGTLIPMFLIHKKGIKLDGTNPTLLYGYGGFNISMLPSFSTSRLAWLENGGIYAIANLRGGGEYGENWYRAGTKLNKQNVFDDFIAAAEYLIEHKYTTSKKLAIMGGSNGGLLIGAVTNQRPDLFKVAVPQVGVMDMLRFHKFTIGWAWVNDYGSSDDSVQFLNLYKYSPLHNIKADTKYPAILVTTADHDDRVVPAHSFKYIATMQEKNPNATNPAIIRIQTRAGHGAGTPTLMAVEEYADIYSFIMYNMGIEPK